MLVLAPMIILLQARPFICKQNKCIQFRQHHILMNIRIITKKRKYLIIQLTCASSSSWSSMYSSRGCGCNNGIDVLITLVQLSLTLKVFKCFMVGMDDEFMWAKVMFPFM